MASGLQRLDEIQTVDVRYAATEKKAIRRLRWFALFSTTTGNNRIHFRETEWLGTKYWCCPMDLWVYGTTGPD
jgi:hypothetical protein